MEKIHTTLSSIIDHCLPYKECTIKYRHIRIEPWLSASLKLSIDQNKKLYAKMLRQECRPENTKHTTACCVKPLGMPKANSNVTNAMSINVKQRNYGD